MILGGKIHLLGKYVNILFKEDFLKKGNSLANSTHERSPNLEPQEPFRIFWLSISKVLRSFSRLDSAWSRLKPAELLVGLRQWNDRTGKGRPASAPPAKRYVRLIEMNRKPQGVNLCELREGFKGRSFSQLIDHHRNRQSQVQRIQGINGSIAKESLTPLTNWRGIGKGTGFMIGPGRRKSISRGLLQVLGGNDGSVQDPLGWLNLGSYCFPFHLCRWHNNFPNSNQNFLIP
jgi:hypothetical protein